LWHWKWGSRWGCFGLESQGEPARRRRVEIKLEPRIDPGAPTSRMNTTRFFQRRCRRTTEQPCSSGVEAIDQGVGNRPLVPAEQPMRSANSTAAVERRERLGGPLNFYYPSRCMNSQSTFGTDVHRARPSLAMGGPRPRNRHEAPGLSPTFSQDAMGTAENIRISPSSPDPDVVPDHLSLA
jgi:hypothetical protein